MDKRYSSLTKNTVIFALGVFGSKIITFFLVPLYTNIFTTAEYGIADLITTISGLLLPLFSISMGESILFYGLKSDEIDVREKYFKNGFIIVLVGCVFLAVLSPFFLFYHTLDGFTWFLPAFAIGEIVRTYLRYYTKSRNKNLVYSLDSIIYAVIVACLNILFLLVLKLGIVWYFWTFIISEVISIVFLLLYNKGFKILFFQPFDKETAVMMIKYSAPLMLNSIMWTISNSSDKIMLDAMVSSEAVGLYSAASKIPTISNTVINLFCQAWTISTYLELKNNDKMFYARIFRLFNFVLILITSAILLVERPFMFVYVGEDFLEARVYVPCLLLASTFQNYATYFGSIIQSGKKNIYMLVSTLVAAILNLGLNYVLILFYGIHGACISTAVSFLTVFILRFIFSKKVICFPTSLVRLAISIFIIVLQAISVVFNWHFIIVSVLCILAILIINFDLLVNLFKKKQKKTDY